MALELVYTLMNCIVNRVPLDTYIGDGDTSSLLVMLEV